MGKKLYVFIYTMSSVDTRVLNDGDMGLLDCNDLNEKLDNAEIDVDKIISVTMSPNFRHLLISYKH